MSQNGVRVVAPEGTERVEPVEPNGSDSSEDWRSRGDVYVPSMAAEKQRVPGSATTKGRRVIAGLMHDTLERVRSSIQERTPRRA